MYELYEQLEPGERVLYRARGAWILNRVFLVLALLIAFAAMHFGAIAVVLDLLVGAGALTTEPDWKGLVDALFGACAGLAVYAAFFLAPVWYLRRFSRGGALVTDRRLLGRSCKRDAEIEVMSLDEIEAIKPGPSHFGTLQVTSRTGRTLSLDPLHRWQRFATALAAAAGLGAPPKSSGAGGLAVLLKPGEQLRYRDPPRRWPHPSLPVIVFAVCSWGMIWLVFESIADDASAANDLLVAALLLGLTAEAYALATMNARGTTAAVTDRRLVYRLTGLGPTFVDVPIAEIDAVQCLAPAEGVMITNCHGHSYRLRSLSDPPAFAESIAEASGARRPPIDGRLARLAVMTISSAALASMVACRFLIEETLGARGISIDDNDAMMVLGGLPLLFGGVAGLALGSMAAIAILRRSATAEEMRAAILALKYKPERPGLGTWWNGVLLRWAALLYGRPPLPADEGAESHGC